MFFLIVSMHVEYLDLLDLVNFIFFLLISIVYFLLVVYIDLGLLWQLLGTTMDR